MPRGSDNIHERTVIRKCADDTEHEATFWTTAVDQGSTRSPASATHAEV
jgi:hypothetical protein